MEYKVRFAQFWIPKYGFSESGTVSVDAESVQISGTKVQGWLLALLPLPCLFFVNDIAEIWLGVKLKQFVLLVIYGAYMCIAYFQWRSIFYASVSVQKRLITNLDRNRNMVGFLVPGPEGMAGGPVKVALKAKNEEEAERLEAELRA